MSHPVNTTILESAQADFEALISRRDWKNAQLIVDYLYDQGFKKEPVSLRKKLLKAQDEFAKESLPKLGGLEYENIPDPESPTLEEGSIEIPTRQMTLEERAAHHGMSLEAYEQLLLNNEEGIF